MRLAPLGDQAILVYLADELAAIGFASAVRAMAPPWLQDVVPAYASVGVFFDAEQVGLGEVTSFLANRERERAGDDSKDPLAHARGSPGTHTIPVCYEFAPDLPRVCEQTGLTADDVIRLHSSTEYTIHAIGFVPGFPYLGYLPEALCGVPRLASPRLQVEPGSVGLTGRQTGIYPLPRPGGWNLIGKTPLTIVDVAAGFFPLRVGDRVKFERIDEKRFSELAGERLVQANRECERAGD
jgi:inhibitor of KinA